MASDLGLPIGKCEEAARRRKGKLLLRKFEAACKELAHIGAQCPNDHAAIRAEYKRTRNNLMTFMDV
jgi:hypothetical protein